MTPIEKRLDTFRGTHALCAGNDRLKAAVAHSRATQKIYWEGEPIEFGSPRFSEPARMILSPKKTVQAAQPHSMAGKRTCILNFASSVSPGGGVLRGSQAQEESICRVTTLFFALSDQMTAGEFYARHHELIRTGKMTRRNRDDIIYTPGVVAVRDDATDEAIMDESDWYQMDVITCAAPDLRRSGDSSQFSPTAEELLALHENRWRCILAAAAKNEVDVLILGAFGCGVFGNPPELVVEAFNNIIPEFRYYFETIEFAVYSGRLYSPNYRAFRQIRDVQES